MRWIFFEFQVQELILSKEIRNLLFSHIISLIVEKKIRELLVITKCYIAPHDVNVEIWSLLVHQESDMK